MEQQSIGDNSHKLKLRGPRVGERDSRKPRNVARNENEDRELEPVHIRADQIHIVWGLVEKDLERALSYGFEGWSTDDIRADCEAGNTYLTVGFRGDEYAGVMVSSLESVPSGPFIHVVYIGGRNLLTEEIIEWFRSEGKRMGAKHINFGSPRKGFRKLPQFREVSRIYRMDI